MEVYGLTPCPNSPCLFYCHTYHSIPCQHPLYLPIYDDDFVYFSLWDEVKRHFETTVQSQLRVGFFGTVESYISIYFESHRDGEDV
jgi:hypothetical protein